MGKERGRVAGMAGGAAVAAGLIATDPGGVVSDTASRAKKTVLAWSEGLAGASREEWAAARRGQSCSISPEDLARRQRLERCRSPSVVRAEKNGKLLDHENEDAILAGGVGCPAPHKRKGDDWHHCRDYADLVPGARYVSPFGPRELNGHNVHHGVDLGPSCGTEVHAPYVALWWGPSIIAIKKAEVSQETIWPWSTICPTGTSW
ncbi:hypothetical protein [Acidithiobacillus sp.]